LGGAEIQSALTPREGWTRPSVSKRLIPDYPFHLSIKLSSAPYVFVAGFLHSRARAREREQVINARLAMSLSNVTCRLETRERVRAVSADPPGGNLMITLANERLTMFRAIFSPFF